MNPFRTFVVARAICWAGNAVTLVALPLLVYQQSGSALLSGVTFAVESLPYLLFCSGSSPARWRTGSTASPSLLSPRC